jgi:hypothetical protein
MYIVIMRRVSVTFVAVTYSERVFIAFQHTKCMNRIVLSSVACPAAPYFSYYLINGTIFEKKGLLNIKSVSILCTTFVWNVSRFKKN